MTIDQAILPQRDDPASREGPHTVVTRPWWAMGQAIPGLAGPQINETATRARAGMLNILSATTIFLLLARPELDPVIYVGPFVILDMLLAAAFGLTPLSPVGMVGTVATLGIRPVWKPTAPKRFAWLLGATLGVVCLSLRLFHISNTWIIAVVSTCFVLTWLEAVLGFCVGCWLHRQLFGCETCEVPYVRR
jgi:hypothetical protein